MLDVRDLTAGYATGTVLRGLSLTVAAGELLVLLGRNGMGKTTLLRAVCGLRPPAPTGGSVRVAGEEVIGLPAYQVARRGVRGRPSTGPGRTRGPGPARAATSRR